MPDRPESLGTRQDLCLPLQPAACEATFFSPGAQPGVGIVGRGTSLPRLIGRVFSFCEQRPLSSRYPAHWWFCSVEGQASVTHPNLMQKVSGQPRLE